MNRLVLSLLFAAALSAQINQPSTRALPGTIQDWGLAAQTLPFSIVLSSSALPSACVVGQTAWVLNATAGQNLYGCTSANTWTQLTGGGAGTGTVTSVGFTGGIVSVATATTTPAFTVAMTSGGVVYGSDSTHWASSGAMASGQFMLGGGAGSAPTTSFSVVPLANGGTNCATPYAVNPQTSTYSVVPADFTCSKTISVASGTFTITLVASGSQPVAGSWIRILNYGSGVVTVARSGQNINGATTSHTLAAGSATAPTGLLVQSDGTNYFAQDFVAAAASGVTSLGGQTGVLLIDSTLGFTGSTLGVATAGLTGTFPTLAGPNTFTAGGKNTFAANTTTAGLTITPAANPSGPAAGDLNIDSGGKFNFYTGTGWGTLGIAAGKTATVSNTLTFTGTDSSSVAFGAGGTATKIIASGATAVDFASTATGACATVVTASASGVASTDAIIFNANASIKAVTGYVPASTGGFSVSAYPTTNTVNFEGCNWTAGTVDPGSITINWLVLRSM